MIKKEWELVKQFLGAQVVYWQEVLDVFLGWAMEIKEQMSKLMYRQRGRFSSSFTNSTMAVMFFLVIVFSGKLEEIVAKSNVSEGGSGYLLTDMGVGGADTLISDLPKGEITEYRVQEGETVSSIASKFGVSIDTIVWENNLKTVDSIKVGQILKILPVTGLKYKVARGETIYSIAKKLQVDPQNIIDYPFNSFSNDETFAIAAGQELIVPEGIKPNEVVVDKTKYLAKTVASPLPGEVGEGKFIWPTNGIITQRHSWYHQAIDIANHSNPPIVAAATGTVITAGWNAGGYGNYVVVDHSNGYQTLYAHMLNGSVLVKAGDKVNQGQKLGTMGSTGRSTGTHLHFEVKLSSGGKVDPLSVLK